MVFLRNFLRVYSYVFETVLCGMGLLLCLFAFANHNVTVDVPWLPWSGSAGIQWIAGLSLAGILCVALAGFGVVRFLLFLYAGGVVYILFRGLFISAKYTFSGPNDARYAVYLVIAAFIAFLGAFPMRNRRTRF